MDKNRWKRIERAVAKKLGGKRLPINGRGKQADVETPCLAVEVKSRQTLPAWLTHAMSQSAAGCKPGQIGLVILHLIGAKHGADMVLLRLDDFMEIFDPQGELNSEEK